MDNEKVWENITNKITGQADENDEAIVREWMTRDLGNRKIYNLLLEIWHYRPKQIYDTSGIYRKFFQRKVRFEKQKTVSPFMYYAIRIAAVLFFVITTTFIATYFISSENSEIAYQEILVPKGSRASLNLPDGTKVWLSNNSRIKYPSEFKGDTRELDLKGEAYFEVVHDKRKPFIVKIGDNRIKVLGTSFSVTAYPEDNSVRADLVEGKIQFDILNDKGDFNSYLLEPLHSLVLDKTSGKLFKSKVPDGFYEYWHKGIYEFSNETLEDLSVKIDRIYNTQIVFEEESLRNKRFSGVISINDNIFTFMEAIKSTSIEPIQYRYEKNKLYINLKK